MSTGNKYHSEFMKENFSDCIAENGIFIKDNFCLGLKLFNKFFKI